MKVPSIGHSARASSPLPGFLVFFLTCYVRSMESAKFKVFGPDRPVTAVVGEEIVLPCHLAPSKSAENMEVTWFRSQISPFVHHYSDRKDQYEQQIPEYQERTELLKDGLAHGNVTLKILHVRVSDEGRYSCFVQDGTFYQEALLELKVAASGSVPYVSLEDYQDGGIRVVCRTAGWYPEPEVVWRDFSGQVFPSVSRTNSQEANGLYGAQASVIIMENSNQNLSCLVRNTLLSQEKESLFYISDPFFPKVNPWKVSLGVTLVALLGSFALSFYLFKIKEKQAAELTKVTLDPDTAHPNLVLSEDRKCVRCDSATQQRPYSLERFDTVRCVLGQEGFTTGRHCWEVEVGDARYWGVGVARESVNRKGGFSLTPKGGIWAVERHWEQFRTLTDPVTILPLSQVPMRIRVCLDCDQRQVTFIDAGAEAPIFIFPPDSLPRERIRPWIWVWDTSNWLQLYP